MTALPLPPARLLTADEFAALPEDTSARYELEEGVVVMVPNPQVEHQECVVGLLVQLRAQAPVDVVVLPEVDLDLELAAPTRPGFVRAPDIVVATRVARDRVRAQRGMLRASEIVLVGEVVSPGRRRTDTVVKRGEYADAGIPYYWVVDSEGGEIVLTVCRLVGGAYTGDVTYRGSAVIAEPFPVTLDLGTLLA